MFVVEICGVGGYDEVGKNMAAVKVGSDAVAFDMGFNVQRLIDFEEEGGIRENVGTDQLIQLDAIPNDHAINTWKPLIKAIALSHGHFDHLGAVPYLEKNYRSPVYGTPYTISVLQALLRDDNMSMKNKIVSTPAGKMIPLGRNMQLEFVSMTHSTLQSSVVALHTKEGVILYVPDFKLDNHPVIGGKPDYERLAELKDEGVLALFADSLYSRYDMKMPSEMVARNMLRDVLFDTENSNNAVVGTCFASHLERLHSFIEFGNKMGREVVLLGRSMMKYCQAAEDIGLVNFNQRAQIVGYGREVKRKLHEIEKKGSSDYLIVCTGGQGEKHSVLSRMMREDYPFRFMNGDEVIFSNRVIPVEPNVANRQEIERRLREFGVRIFSDVHVSGHAAKEDIRELIQMTDPKHFIPCHGPPSLMSGAVELTQEMGYKLGKDVHLLENGKKLVLH
jgi:ribonuclease J